VTEEDDKANAETLQRYKDTGGGALPTFKTHDELRSHLIEMSDTELNRMRDFGCGKPHWSPYYVEAAYQAEAGVIAGDSQSMKYTRQPKSKEPTPRSLPPSAIGSRSGSRASSKGSKGVPALEMVKEMDATQFINSARSNRSAKSNRSNRSELLKAAQASARSQRTASARSTANERESKRIEELLITKEREIQELREQLAMTKAK